MFHFFFENPKAKILFINSNWRKVDNTIILLKWSVRTPYINAAIVNFRNKVLAERNNTINVLNAIASSNAQTARNNLAQIRKQIETCVNNTLTTTVEPTTAAPIA